MPAAGAVIALVVVGTVATCLVTDTAPRPQRVRPRAVPDISFTQGAASPWLPAPQALRPRRYGPA